MTKVFYRTMRPYENGYGEVTKYIQDPKYAQQPKAYIRALETIQKDLLNIFDFIEPTEKNLKCYSFRIHELFLRSCIEIEANFKAILTENNYKKNPDKWNQCDYKKLAKTHNLSNYKVKIPCSHDEWSTRNPFKDWSDSRLNWYDDYNSVKHSRVDKFEKSNLENLLDAVCGLLIILSAQFYTENFTRYGGKMRTNSIAPATMQLALGDYFLISFPSLDTWEKEHLYIEDQVDNFEFTDLLLL